MPGAKPSPVTWTFSATSPTTVASSPCIFDSWVARYPTHTVAPAGTEKRNTRSRYPGRYGRLLARKLSAALESPEESALCQTG